jgi:hypothetical protein
MLDDVERRRFLVEPAGKHPSPTPVRPLDVDLDERAGQFFFLPRRGGLACAKAHDDVLPTHRLAGMERNILNNPVALVEDGEHRDALAHRGHARSIGTERHRLIADHRLRRILLVTLAARGKSEGDQQRNGETLHVYSGIQGS